MYVETVKVPINKLETFHDTLIKGATDLGNQYDTIISTCGKIQEYWESEGWADIYSDLVSKMDTMQAFMEDMYSYGDTLGGRCIEYQRQKKCVCAADPADRSGKYKGGHDSLVTGIFTAMTLGLLVFFKYMDFLADSVNRILGTQVPMVQIALPVGISFIQFSIKSLYFTLFGIGEIFPSQTSNTFFIKLFSVFFFMIAL